MITQLIDQNDTETLGEEKYTASGTLETVQETIISVRNAKVETKQETESEAVRRSTGPQVVSSNVISTSTNTRAVREWYDPLAQSYQVLDETGVFLTSCDVFFQTKDDMDIPMTFQLRHEVVYLHRKFYHSLKSLYNQKILTFLQMELFQLMLNLKHQFIWKQVKIMQ